MSEPFSFREINLALGDLGLDVNSRIIVHISSDFHSRVRGGLDTLMGALLENCETIITPAFTYRTMVTPPSGPPNNAMEYGIKDAQNQEAEVFDPVMPVDAAFGPFPEMLRRRPDSTRSVHPILSFTGIRAREPLRTQELGTPLAPIEWLGEFDGDVLLIDTDHSANFSIHLGEQIAGRRTFTRWALTPSGVVECDNMPGCSQGFEGIRSRLDGVTARVSLGEVELEIVPVRDLLHITSGWIREDPKALLCGRSDCLYCPAIRESVRESRRENGT